MSLMFIVNHLTLLNSSTFGMAVEHASENAESGGEKSFELTNLVQLISQWLEKTGNEKASNFMHLFENPIFFVSFIILPIAIWAIVTYRRVTRGADRESRANIPKGFNQNFWEMIVQGLADFTEQGLGLGERGRSYVPFIGSLFLFILLNNLLGLIPLFKSPTSSLNTTLGLAIVVFFTVQIHGIRALGLFGWILHLAGIERGNPLTYAFAILMFPLHVLSELIKPMSLSLRLYGNIFGEDLLLAAFVGFVAFVPLQTPFYFLAILTSFIQTMVFTLLACSYLASFSHTPESHHEVQHA